jgi:hypothetical protein
VNVPTVVTNVVSLLVKKRPHRLARPSHVGRKIELKRLRGGSHTEQRVALAADDFDKRRNFGEIEQSTDLPGNAAEHEVNSSLTSIPDTLRKSSNTATINGGNIVKIEHHAAIPTNQIGNELAETRGLFLEQETTAAMHYGHFTRHSRSQREIHALPPNSCANQRGFPSRNLVIRYVQDSGFTFQFHDGTQ